MPLAVGDLERDGVLLVQDGNHGEYRPRREEFSDDGVAFVRAANLQNGTVDFDGADKINASAMARIRKGIGQPFDLILTHKGTVGRLARVPHDAPPFVCSPQTTFWRVLDRNRLDPAYLYAYLRSPAFARQLYSRQHESDMAAYVSLTAQRKFELPIPPMAEQRRVGGVLGALDDKIEANRRLAQTLEEIAATLFRARFVDFVGVEEFEESEIGPIPVGWWVSSLDSIARFVNGGALTKHANGKGLPIIRIRELNRGLGADTPRSDIEVKPDQRATHFDLLFAWSGSLEVYRWIGPEVLINQHIFKVVPEDYPSWFVEAWLRHHLAAFQAIAQDKATTMGHIQRHHLRDAKIALAPAEAVAASDEQLAPLLAQRSSTLAEQGPLIVVRDALLPKLISGQIRVPDTYDPDEVLGPAIEAETAPSA